MFSGRLILDYNRCPPGCSDCLDSCNRKKEDDLGLVQTVKLAEKDFNGILTCRQCRVPLCIEVCPTGAITRDKESGVITINEAKCAGCGLCSLSCCYGGIKYNHSDGKSNKCDLCLGDPECAHACKYAALTYFKANDLKYRLSGKDLLAPGVTLCAGCTVELAERAMFKIIGNKDIIYFSSPGCNAPAVNGAAWYGGGSMPTLGANLMACMMTNMTACMTGMSRYFRKIGTPVKCVCFVGDGTTADIGFQSLSAAAERGENILYICYDNEGYMNTGIQRSSTTPAGSWTSTTWIGEQSRGKSRNAKNIPLIMLMHHIPYVATATVAYLEDFIAKLEKAKSVTSGLAYIHLLAPCPTGWRAAVDSGVQLSRLAVQTNYFPLWEAENGKVRFTYQEANPRPIREFTKPMGRFSHLSETETGEFQRMVDERYREIEKLVACSK